MVHFNEQSYKGRDYKSNLDLDQIVLDLEQLVPGPIDQVVLKEQDLASGSIDQAILDLEQLVPSSINQVVSEKQEEPISSTDQPLDGGEASMTIEPTSQTTPVLVEEQSDSPTATLPPTNGRVGIRRSAWIKHPSFKLRSAFSARVQSSTEPISYWEAVKHPYSKQWEEAMKEEFEALNRNRTWDLVDEEPILKSGKRVIGCKWVYKLKRNLDGTKRFKARLVIWGFEQEYGIDYNETFAPVAKFVTVRILLTLAARFNWEIKQMDVVTAFLNPLL
jgi:hypothetical protein